MGLVVRIEGRRIHHSNLTCTNVRRGGYESCTFQFSDQSYLPPKGSDVSVFDGLSYVWNGYVDEVGITHEGGARGINVSAVGYGATLKRNPFSMIYVDRDLSRWRGPSNNRIVGLTGGGSFQPSEHSVSVDEAGAFFETFWVGAWAINQRPICEPIYDAGVGNLIGNVSADWKITGTNVNTADYIWEVMLCEDDGTTELGTTTNNDWSGNLRAAGPSSTSVSATTQTRRVATIRFYYTTNIAAGVANQRYSISWSNVRVYGLHGLATSGGTSATEGILATDIIRHALATGQPGFTYSIDENSYVVRHTAYYDLTEPEKIIDDMAKLLGWHYGTWVEAFNPIFQVYAPPTDVTCSVQYADCIGVDVNDKLSELHNECITIGANAGGTQLRGSATNEHPGIPQGATQTLIVNVGLVSNADELDAQAAFYLALDQDGTRAAGSIQQMPSACTDGRATHFLQAGKDRIAINGLPNSGTISGEGNAARNDTFQISRVSVSESNGVVQTSIEIDSGADLTETFQARLAVDDVAAGV